MITQRNITLVWVQFNGLIFILSVYPRVSWQVSVVKSGSGSIRKGYCHAESFLVSSVFSMNFYDSFSNKIIP